LRIECPECVVRSWEPGDAASLARHADCREVWANLRDSFPSPYSEADAVRFLEFCLSREPETNFAIEVQGQAAGSIGVRLGEDVERVSAEIGYWVGRKFWGRGVATAALRAVRDHAIRAFALTRLFALPFEGNQASIRVLEKAGFTREGRLRRSAIKDGKVLDQWMYAFVVPPEGDFRRCSIGGDQP